jgi:hypothetical protein
MALIKEWKIGSLFFDRAFIKNEEGKSSLRNLNERQKSQK